MVYDWSGTIIEENLGSLEWILTHQLSDIARLQPCCIHCLRHTSVFFSGRGIYEIRISTDPLTWSLWLRFQNHTFTRTVVDIGMQRCFLPFKIAASEIFEHASDQNLGGLSGWIGNETCTAPACPF